MLRKVSTAYGELSYSLQRKKVKNLNLRVSAKGEILLSVPMKCPLRLGDEMVSRKARWICDVLRGLEETPCDLPPMPSREICRQMLEQAVYEVYPLVAGAGVAMPEIRLRKMKSQWGNCHWAQGYITLNTALARCPSYLREYVALHELVHFLHHDHSALFYQAMEQRMPDWRQRRAQLKQYRQALLE